jgi:hypothetical protein
MRWAGWTALGLLLLAGCQRHDLVLGETDEGEIALASALPMSEPALEPQLLSGFYAPEPGGWRWTAGKFSVALGVPPGARARGGRLLLSVYVAEPLIGRFGSQTLAVKVAGQPLPPETYRRTGEYVFARDLPRAWLTAESVLVEGELDRFARPGEFDGRELGLIVRSLALEPKEDSRP